MPSTTSTASSFEIRELTRRDLPFLREMLLEAVFWRRPRKKRYPAFVVLRHPKLAKYHRGWGRPGDAGLVAVEDGRRIGAVWYRLFTDEEHGSGYIDPQTPELAIAVVADRRSAGVGRALMEAVHELARRKGIERMGLSVERDNYSKRLYESLGYVELVPDDPACRMVLALQRSNPGSDPGSGPQRPSAGTAAR